jgi:bacteriorhodopsin
VPAEATTRPELVPLDPGAHDLIHFSLVVAGFALLASTLKTWHSTGEVGARYRPAVLASLAVTGVAFLSYVYLVLEFDQGYDLRGGTYLPNAEALNTLVPRYMDWAVTVPLLVVEFLAVSAVVGAAARATRFALVGCAFLMIVTGFLGAAVHGDGTSRSALIGWGIVSTVFYAALHVLLIGVLRRSRGAMGAQARTSYRNATILLLSVWGWYPIAYALQVWTTGQWWTVTIQVGFSAADVAAKVGFGTLIHKVAKLRTAEEVRAGGTTHPEEVWISSVKLSDGVQPALVDGAGRRPEQP